MVSLESRIVTSPWPFSFDLPITPQSLHPHPESFPPNCHPFCSYKAKSFICYHIPLFLMNLTSVFNGTSICIAFALSSALEPYLLCFEVVCPHLISPPKHYNINAGFCKMQRLPWYTHTHLPHIHQSRAGHSWGLNARPRAHIGSGAS